MTSLSSSTAASPDLPAVRGSGSARQIADPAGRRSVRPLSLRRNFTWTFAGQTIFSASNWLMLIAIAKLGTPAMVGQYALGVAITQPVFMLTNLSLRNVQVQDIRGEWRFGHFAAVRLLGILIALAAVAGLTCWFASSREAAWVILLTGIGVAIDSVSELAYAVFTVRDRMDRMALSLAGRGVLSLALLAGGVALTGSVAWGVAGSALASGLTLAGYDLPSCARLAGSGDDDARRGARACLQAFVPQFEWPALWRLMRFAIPLGLILCLGSLGTHVPRYFVERLLGERALGLFAAMSLIINAGRTAVLSLAYATARPMAQAWERRDRRAFLRVLARMTAVCAVVGMVPALVALLGGGGPLLARVYKPEYAQYSDVFALVLATGALLYLTVCLGCAMTAAKVNTLQLWWMAAATLTIVLLDAWMVPAWGLRGAACASLVAALLQCLSGAGILTWMLARLTPADFSKETR